MLKLPKAASRSKPTVAAHFIGRVIKEARRDRYTVEQLAERSGVSSGLVSQLERGIGNPSVGTLEKLAAALDRPVASFFVDTGVFSVLVRGTERHRLELPHEGVVYEMLTPFPHRSLAVMRTKIAVGFTNASKPFQHVGEECVHVLVGTLDFFLRAEHHVLQPGDSLTFDSGVPHWWENRSNRTVEIVDSYSGNGGGSWWP